jgi:hypothetical protein
MNQTSGGGSNVRLLYQITALLKHPEKSAIQKIYQLSFSVADFGYSRSVMQIMLRLTRDVHGRIES